MLTSECIYCWMQFYYLHIIRKCRDCFINSVAAPFGIRLLHNFQWIYYKESLWCLVFIWLINIVLLEPDDRNTICSSFLCVDSRYSHGVKSYFSQLTSFANSFQSSPTLSFTMCYVVMLFYMYLLFQSIPTKSFILTRLTSYRPT